LRPVRIIHCGDFHFDTPFSELSGTIAEQRKEDLRETFGRIVEHAQSERIDLLLISGDLFDNQRVSRMTTDYLIHKLLSIPEVKVFISPGNHDPYHEKSYYHLISWPENVHIFKGDFEKVELSELNTCVYGRGFTWSHQQESLLKGFRIEDPGKLNIMVLHGDVVLPGRSSDYNPISREEIKESGLDYLALGHCHTYTDPEKAGETFWAYSGCPEGRAFDELGDKGMLCGELSKGSCRLTYRSLCKRQYLEINIDVTGCRTNEDITTKVITGTHNLKSKQNLFKIILSGELPEDFSLYPSVIQEKLRDKFYFVRIVDKTKTMIDFNKLTNDFSLKGIFAKKIVERLEKTEDPGEQKKLELALKFGLHILEQGKLGIE
jgi:exonuclease SbcD